MAHATIIATELLHMLLLAAKGPGHEHIRNDPKNIGPSPSVGCRAFTCIVFNRWLCDDDLPRHRLKFEFHAQQPNGSEFSVEMMLGSKVCHGVAGSCSAHLAWKKLRPVDLKALDVAGQCCSIAHSKNGTMPVLQSLASLRQPCVSPKCYTLPHAAQSQGAVSSFFYRFSALVHKED